MVSISVTHFSPAICLTLASFCLAICFTPVCACLSHSHVCLAVCPTDVSVCLSCSICLGVCLVLMSFRPCECSTHVCVASACICPTLRIGGLAAPQSCLATRPILCLSECARGKPEELTVPVAAVAGGLASVSGGGDPRPAPRSLLPSPGQVCCCLQARSP